MTYYSWGSLQITNFIDNFEQDYFLPNDGPGHRRPKFMAMCVRSLVAGVPEMCYPQIRRKLQYLFSTIVTNMYADVTKCMLTLAFWGMILSLNLHSS
jgi:hypothetical protein